MFLPDSRKVTCPGDGIPPSACIVTECDARLVVLGQMASEMWEKLPVSLGGCSVVLEVEDQPQFEAGIGYGHFDVLVPRLVNGLWHISIVIDIEDALHLVIVGLPAVPKFCCVFDEPQGLFPTGRDFYGGCRISQLIHETTEIGWLSGLSAAHDQQQGKGIPARRPAADVCFEDRAPILRFLHYLCPPARRSPRRNVHRSGPAPHHSCRPDIAAPGPHSAAP